MKKPLDADFQRCLNGFENSFETFVEMIRKHRPDDELQDALELQESISLAIAKFQATYERTTH